MHWSADFNLPTASAKSRAFTSQSARTAPSIAPSLVAPGMSRHADRTPYAVEARACFSDDSSLGSSSDARYAWQRRSMKAWGFCAIARPQALSAVGDLRGLADRRTPDRATGQHPQMGTQIGCRAILLGREKGRPTGDPQIISPSELLQGTEFDGRSHIQ